MNTLLIPDVYWVGAVDWNVRDFHGYQTDRGSTYNAYVIRDERSVLIDTVKAPFADVLLRNVNEVLNLSSLTYVVCNHAEPDHSGSLSAVMSRYPQAELVCNAKCKDALSRHYDVSGWKFKVVADGDTLSLGRKTLAFADTPMAHWPESMVTYLTDDRLLFSMDAFGQHYASSERFDDHNAMDEVMA